MWSWNAALLFTAGVFAKTVVNTLTLTDAIIAPDGFNRSAIVVNGITPGTVITANKGDTIQVKVQNQLTDESMNRSTSVHWHGIRQYHNNAMDGAAFVTQCPIAPGQSFTYQFSTGNQAGTFWYHSHFRRQLCEGLRGPLIIYDPNDPYKSMYDVDNASTIITISDWYHINAFQIATNLPDSLLVNGLGRYSGGPPSPLAVINVVQGKRYRFRLLNIACVTDYVFSIDNHVLTIIEADGEPTQPLVVDSIVIGTAQRYSFVLEANQPVDNYWIRGNLSEATTSFDNGLNSAILRYSGAPVADPPTRNWTLVNELQEYNLHGVNTTVPGVPGVGDADVNLNLVAQFNATAVQWNINNVSYTSPETPILLQILSGALTTAQLVPQGSIYTLPPNKSIEVSFPGALLASSHSFHLHGHAFDVVRSAGSTQYNYVNPVRRDTVRSGTPTDNVTIRFATDNAGPWFLHCHIDVHLDLGMAVVFAEDPADTAASDPVTSQWKQLCNIYDALPPSEQ
ncbi:laccase [Phlebopus sp. FC_14]|nr:laccase [Phlebopus sp. FC_14]